VYGAALNTLKFLLEHIILPDYRCCFSFIPGEYQRVLAFTPTNYQECRTENGNIYVIQVILVPPKISLSELPTEQWNPFGKYFCSYLRFMTGHLNQSSPKIWS
jgi:hypothetical protein